MEMTIPDVASHKVLETHTTSIASLKEKTQAPEKSQTKEQNRSRCFRLTLTALIEEMRELIDSVEVPTTGLCKNSVLAFGLKYIVLKDVLSKVVLDKMYNLFNPAQLNQSSRCFIVFDSKYEIHYVSENTNEFFGEPQSYVMKNNLEKYLTPESYVKVKHECNSSDVSTSTMLSLKSSLQKIILRAKKYVLKTRTIWIGSCDFCSLSISPVSRYTKTFFLETRWTLSDLLIQSANSDKNVRKIEAIKFMGLLHGYFSVDLDLCDRVIICKAVTIYSEDNFPVYFAGSIFSFNKFHVNNQIPLRQSLIMLQENPYPLDFTVDSNRRYLEFTKIFCNYMRLKHTGNETLEAYMNVLLDPLNSSTVVIDDYKDQFQSIDILEQCFNELYEVYRTNSMLWRGLQSTIGYIASDLKVKNVFSVANKGQ